MFIVVAIGVLTFFHDEDVSSGQEFLAVETETVETETAETEIAEIEIVEAETVETETVETEAVETEIAETETVETEAVETEIAETETQVLTVTLSVVCDEILQNMDRLDENKRGIVPEDGVIFPVTEIEFYEGETVFNVLLREMKRNQIHMEYTNTPIYNSAYIEGIGNLYEFDCGPLSGWIYSVNGWFPNYGVSGYVLADGDEIVLSYTCEGSTHFTT